MNYHLSFAFTCTVDIYLVLRTTPLLTKVCIVVEWQHIAKYARSFTINPMQRNSSRHEVTHEVMYSPMSRSAERQHVQKKQTIEGPYAYYQILAMLFDGEISGSHSRYDSSP
jgi:hypothetical protein